MYLVSNFYEQSLDKNSLHQLGDKVSYVYVQSHKGTLFKGWLEELSLFVENIKF